MKKTRLLFNLICMLLVSFSSKAMPGIPTISITPASGSDTVCEGTLASYSVAPVLHGYYYQWSTPDGYPGGTAPSVSINWTAPGFSLLKLYVFDSTGDTIAKGSLPIYVEPMPAPFITSPESFACQPLYGVQFTDTDKCYNVCSFASGAYLATDLGMGGGHFHWSGTGYTILTPIDSYAHIIWGAVGAGSLTLIDTSEYGCISKQTYCINIVPIPTVNVKAEGFGSAKSITVCDSSFVTFTDTTTAPLDAPIVTYLWSGIGSPVPTSIDEPYTVQFNTPGTYIMQLAVIDACGCGAGDSIVVHVNATHVVPITCPGVVCEGDTVTYKAGATCSTYAWSIIGGTALTALTGQSVTVKWNNVDTNGFGYLNLTTAGCSGFCTSLSTAIVPVMKQSGTIEGPAVVCPNSQYIYNLPQWPSTDFNWNVTTTTGSFTHPSDQPNQIILQTGDATGTITLTANYVNTLLGCGGVATKTITIQPQVYISPVPEKVCLNTLDSFYLSGTVSGTWHLKYPDLTTHTATGLHAGFLFNESGTYQLSVTGAFCAPDAVTIVVDPALPAPDSITGPDTICRGVPVTFTGNHLSTSTVFGWAVVNGTIDAATGNSTDAIFNSGAGPYKIELWRISATDPHCHSDTITKTLDTTIIHIAITGPDTVCPSSFESYLSTYTSAETYNWSIFPTTAGSVSVGDGTDSIVALWNNPTGAGALANLIVKERKCTGTFVDTVKVWIKGIGAPSTMSFSVGDTVCQGASFTASLSPAPADTVVWSFGDGGSVTATGPVSYAYIHPDTTAVSFIVTATYHDVCGYPLSTSKVIWVIPSPVVTISTSTSPLTYCDTVGITATLNASIQAGYGLATTLEWYQDGSPFTGCSGPPFGCATLTAGFHDYYAVVVNSDGCFSSSNHIALKYGCDSISCGTGPLLFDGVDSTHVLCGHIHMHGYFNPPAYTAGWIAPTGAYNVVQTPHDFDCEMPAPGHYSVEYVVSYTTADSTACNQYIYADAIVPMVASMKNAVTCAAGANYNVTLLDHSSYYAGTTFTNVYQVNSGALVGSGASYTTTLSGPATYYLHDWVTYNLPGTGGGVGTCEARDTLILPSKPVAAFTYSHDTTCIIDTAVVFNSSGSIGTGLTYAWAFGDSAFNSQPNPYRVYSALLPNPKPVTLTITDEYGCSNSVTHGVAVIADNMFGGLNSTSPGCAGGSVSVFDVPALGDPFGEKYRWYDNLTPFAVTSAHTETVFSAGGYWAIVTNHYGCRQNRSMRPVLFAAPPPSYIIGDTSACDNANYKLSAFSSGDTGAIYTWIKNGVVVSSGTDDFMISNDFAGTYNYKLVTAVLNGAGSYCTDTSAVFRVTVIPSAPPPVLAYHVTSCNPYTINLTATDTYGGSNYSWSNGNPGASINTSFGGKYLCTYTSPQGCVSQAEISTPINPKAYLWMFPVGCVSICNSSLPRDITGPSASEIDRWSWIKNGTAAASGTGPIPPYAVTTTGQYRMSIGDDDCRDTSGVLNFTAKTPCVSCGNSFYQTLVVITQTTTGGGCKDTVKVTFSNTTGAPALYDISASDGMFLPASGTASTGSSTIKFRYIADVDSDVTVDTSVLVSVIVHKAGGDCLDTFRIHIHPCDNSYAPRLANGGDNGTQATTTEALLAFMQIVPNPAANSTSVYYDFATDVNAPNATKYIEVYDMSGRIVARHEVQDDKGKWQVSLDNYTSGLYIIVMRKDGRLLLESKLSVAK